MAAAWIGCARSRSSDAPSCPASFHADEGRTRALLARLRSDAEGERLAARLAERASIVCFGDIPISSVTPGRTFLMDSRLGEMESAARLGHLVMHAVDGAPMSAMERDASEPARDCARQVDEALSAEARAFALELRLRRAFGVHASSSPTLAYAFEDDFWKAAPEAREPLLKAYLLEHPDGAPGVDALASGYLKRCLDR